MRLPSRQISFTKQMIESNNMALYYNKSYNYKSLLIGWYESWFHWSVQHGYQYEETFSVTALCMAQSVYLKAIVIPVV